MTKEIINTPEELLKAEKNGLVKKLHTSLCCGYVSRKTGRVVKKYKGKFGEGFVLLSPNWESTRYSYVTYFIK